MTHPLIGEALKKVAVAWVAVGDAPPRLVWCLSAEGALWMVTGPREQQVPGLAEADRARVTLRGDHGGRVVTWQSTVSRVMPGGEEWDSIVPQLAAKRLNAAGDPDTVAARWAADCAVLRLAPTGEPLEAGPTLPDDRHGEPPRESPARRRTRAPFRLHRVRR